MKKFIVLFCLIVGGLYSVDYAYCSSPISISDADINKILKAKNIVRNMVNYPDTLVFHEFYTRVSGNIVTLKFTCQNGFGVPETYIKDITIN